MISKVIAKNYHELKQVLCELNQIINLNHYILPKFDLLKTYYLSKLFGFNPSLASIDPAGVCANF